jgi:hypothetical protein
MRYLRRLTYMTWWDLTAAALLLLLTLTFMAVGIVSAVIGIGWPYVVLCGAAAVLVGYALCVMVWACVGMGRMYTWGIRYRNVGKGRRRK